MTSPQRLALALALSSGLAGIMAVAPEAYAQSVRSPGEQSDSRSALGTKPLVPADSASLGIPLGNGMYMVPVVSTEFGHDTNPDDLVPKDASAYSLVSLTDVIGRKTDVSETTLAVVGTFENFDGLARSDRYEAGAALDTYHIIGEGLELRGGASFLRDELKADQTETAAAYGSILKRTETWEGYVEARVNRLDYINEFAVDPAVLPALKPMFQSDQYNRHRSEVTIGNIVGRNKPVALYSTFTYADIDYPDLVGTHFRERNATETSTLTGLRWTPSPFFQADIGYRFNSRRFKSGPLAGHSNGYLDFSATWIPTSRFKAGIEVDRSLIDPAAPLASVADQIQYSAFINYQLNGRWAVSGRVAQRRTEEVGTQFEFRETDYELGTTYDVTSNVQLYVNGFYRDFEEFAGYVEQERFRIGAGMRWRLTRGEGGSLMGNPVESGPLTLIGEDMKLSVGYSHLELPGTHMAVITNAFLTEAVGYHTEHDGKLDGVKVDIARDGLGTWEFGNGHYARIDGKGFFAAYESTQQTHCAFSDQTDCVYMNLKDGNPNAFDSNTNAFGLFDIETTREARAWGAAIEMQFGSMHGGGSLKDADAAPVKSLSPLKVGLAVRGLKQETHLHAEDISVPDPVDYHERLDTYYYGAYFGFERSMDVRDFTISLNAEAGVYGTETRYSGHYKSYFTTDGTVYLLDEGYARATDRGDAAIASVRADVSRNVGWGKIGAFAEAEYISSVPTIRHNNVDLDGGFPFDIAGDNAGVKLESGDALSYTVGARLSIPLGGH